MTKDDIKTLSAPFDAATVGVKVQSFSKDRTKAMLVCYLQHTDVYGRLEQVDPTWSCEVTSEQRIGDSWFVRIKMTVQGVSRENSGEGDDPKSAVSDAIKRAAMLFGVGRYLYDAEQVWVPYNESTDKFKTFTLADYQGALRGGQARLPTAAAASQAPKPAPAPLKAVAPLSLSRDQIAAEIVKVAGQLKLSKAEMSDWIQQEFKKPMLKLTTAEMEQFLGILQGELGRKGV